MLKALELAGFKSFADRTRFEFPLGITVVVGPNGSGKSNIVDAIKWVLGEQSVKSLRGREMADVIFNGSRNRRAINAAEITLTLDNSKRLLAIDAPEVYITRRVYRSGEGEYLLNRNPARLRDIRDLLSGTGMGTQAYSVIEQGKVDALLQSSARDRRAIFEEAAGISRFKARKIEALRRLERVSQNLLRLSDIVDEVDNRLRGIRAQAAKARRYKEYADRLQELRTQVCLVDWNRLGQRLAEHESQLQSLADDRAAAEAAAQRGAAQLLEIDGSIDALGAQLHSAEAEIAANRERIAAAESTVEHERRRGEELDEEIARHRRQLTAMSTRAGDVQQQLQDTAAALQTAEENRRLVAGRLADAERELAEVAAELDRLHDEMRSRRSERTAQMQAAAVLGNEIAALESRLSAAAAAKRRSVQRIADLDLSLDSLQGELDELRRRRAGLAEQAEEQTAWLAAARDQIGQCQERHAARQNELSELRQRYSGAAERAAVLEELIRRHEGLSAGVKEVLERAATDPAFRSVAGLAADLLHVSVEAAPLVEIALGPAAQHVAAGKTPELLQCLQTEAGRFSGRVGFLWLEGEKGSHGENNAAENSSDPFSGPGVLGRADRFVETQAKFLPLARRLLGRTWFVEKLAHAWQLSQTVGAGMRFVTLAGELLESDGTLVVGPRSAASGVILRRSQLRALQGQLAELQNAIQAAEKNVAELSEQIAAGRQRLDRRSAEHGQTLDALAENRVAITAAEERRRQLDQQRTAFEAESQAAEAQHAETFGLLAEARLKRQQLDAAAGKAEAELTRLAEQIERLEGRRSAGEQTITEIKVELAKCEERLQNLQARMRQFEESRQERRRAIDEVRQQLAECQRRGAASQQTILAAEAEIAELYLRKESFASQSVVLVERRDAFQRQRTELAGEVQKINARMRKLEEKMHAAELAANEVRHERNALADRMREDYGVELATLERPPDERQPPEREEVQQEIDQLRQKLANLGNVNLESLVELEQLESRYQALFDQHHDLSEARASLEKIIDRINVDSRRLFTETLDTVRGHFQTLFRDLFGGGQADIVLEENVDILDSGIEIVARPPGKEPRSISLLSGGEKTLTCVALLLAIFRSRPSPFCVLDEVDAALDEANIDRFTQVLRGFLAWTQFIIVTHSKKTMTCANTIYGVTMQESGVSKQVSVRFEDVSDDGRILTAPPEGEAARRAA